MMTRYYPNTNIVTDAQRCNDGRMGNNVEREKPPNEDEGYEDQLQKKSDKAVDEVDRHHNGSNMDIEQTHDSEGGIDNGGLTYQVDHRDVTMGEAEDNTGPGTHVHLGVDVEGNDRDGPMDQSPPELDIEEDDRCTEKDKNYVAAGPASKSNKGTETQLPQEPTSKRKQKPETATDPGQPAKRKKVSNKKRKQSYTSDEEDDEKEQGPRWVKLEEDIFVSSPFYV